MRQYRPQGCRGPGDAHLGSLAKGLFRVLVDVQKTFVYKTLRLSQARLKQLAEILVEFGEDIHNDIGIWAAYEAHNLECFGVPIPFVATREAGSVITLDRVHHLLWALYPELESGLIVSPTHQDLGRLSQAATPFLAEAFRSVPKGSGVKVFLETPNQYGWEVKRKLVWLGSCSYMFRLHIVNYLEEHNRGKWDIGPVDDFLCQECTRWSGLGPIDILAGVLNMTPADRLDLMSWHERHSAFYWVQGTTDGLFNLLNVISNQPYRVRIDRNDHLFKPGSLIFGNLVRWRDEWYWSGEQEIWDSWAAMDVDGLRDTMKRKNSAIVCRFWKEYEEQVRTRAAELHQASLNYHGQDLVVYSDGLAMAADWQQEMRAMWESRSPEQIEQVVRKHRLKQRRPDLNIPRDLLEHKNGLGVFLHPVEGKEIMCEFRPLVEGLKRKGADLAEDEEDAILQFVTLDGISPAFVKRVLNEYGDVSVRVAFRLGEDLPSYWLDYLLRRHKGRFYRKRYPAVSVV